MRVVVTGATGNVGTSVLAALAGEPAVDQIVGVARRLPDMRSPKTTWVAADVLDADLASIFSGADCVIHLAWLIQPSHDRTLLRAVNVEGSSRVMRAVATAKVPALVYASSIGAYSPGPKDRRVDESWPTDGVPGAHYAQDKAAVERLLDRFERETPDTRVVRLRPGLIFKRDAASEIRRYFVGPLLPSALVRRRLVPVVPRTERLAFQAVHSLDVGHAYRLAAIRDDVRGAFNVASEPVLDSAALAKLLGARQVPVPARLLRGFVDVSWRLRLQPTDASWVDLALGVPLMDTTRAREELGWEPSRRADDALLELLDGLRESAGFPTPPLATDAGGKLRGKELATGVGGRP